MDTAIWVALITSVGTAVVLKFIDIKWLPKKEQTDIATVIRDEIRVDYEKCKTENSAKTKVIEHKDREIDYWKRTYFQLIELLYKNHVDVPDKYIQPYRDDPSTPANPPEK